MQQKKLRPLWKIRLQNYEFWPFWLFYFPMYFYGFWLAIKAKSFTYFTAANPALHFGGLLNTSKSSYLKNVEARFIPCALTVYPKNSFQEICLGIDQKKMKYPLVAKPDMGERGRGVEQINNVQELERYFGANRKEVVLLQEFIGYPLELGILYYRTPNGQSSGITSIVIKEFLKVEGDGKATLRELISKNTRARFRQAYLEEKFKNQLDNIFPPQKIFNLEPIGNHNRGTTFLNGNHLINSKLVQVMDKLAQPLEGFFYGRFDLKTQSIEDLYRGEHIKILEINGVNSEPAHIYQPGYSLAKAYQDIRQHMKIIYHISTENHKKGIPYAPLLEVLKELRQHFK